ncbi:SRPBCC family protein [soil metagenome]|jgi:uncharacterized protein YndB with AHSA1/START domain
MATKNQTKITAEPGKQELFITREFDAPRELVFKAFTDPALYVQWLGPTGYQMTLEQFEPWCGGSYKYFHSDNDGNAYAFHGTFHEVLAPERIIGTFEFDGMPEKGNVEFDTSKFTALPGDRTKLVIQAVYQSVQARDGMIRSGMERGITEGFNTLDEVLAKQNN